MLVKQVTPQNFNGNLVFVDRYGRKANPELTKALVSQLGSTVSELRSIITPKPFDLFISKDKPDYISINANKSYRGVLQGETNFYSLHKSTLNNIVQVAKNSTKEYENFLQKNV